MVENVRRAIAFSWSANVVGPGSWCQFHQHFMHSSYARRSQKLKKTLMTQLSFFAHLGSARVNAARKTLEKLILQIEPNMEAFTNLTKSGRRSPTSWSLNACLSTEKWSQFYQHFMSNFFVQKCFAQLFSN